MLVTKLDDGIAVVVLLSIGDVNIFIEVWVLVESVLVVNSPGLEVDVIVVNVNESLLVDETLLSEMLAEVESILEVNELVDDAVLVKVWFMAVWVDEVKNVEVVLVVITVLEDETLVG